MDNGDKKPQIKRRGGLSVSRKRKERLEREQQSTTMVEPASVEVTNLHGGDANIGNEDTLPLTRLSQDRSHQTPRSTVPENPKDRSPPQNPPQENHEDRILPQNTPQENPEDRILVLPHNPPLPRTDNSALPNRRAYSTGLPAASCPLITSPSQLIKKPPRIGNQIARGPYRVWESSVPSATYPYKRSVTTSNVYKGKARTPSDKRENSTPLTRDELLYIYTKMPTAVPPKTRKQLDRSRGPPGVTKCSMMRGLLATQQLLHQSHNAMEKSHLAMDRSVTYMDSSKYLFKKSIGAFRTLVIDHPEFKKLQKESTARINCSTP